MTRIVLFMDKTHNVSFSLPSRWVLEDTVTNKHYDVTSMAHGAALVSVLGDRAITETTFRNMTRTNAKAKRFMVYPIEPPKF